MGSNSTAALRGGDQPYVDNSKARLTDLLIVQAVVNANGSRKLAAECLGISRYTIIRALARYANRCDIEAFGPPLEFC